MLLAAPLAAEGQSARSIPRIGFLGTFQESPHYQAFAQGLHDVGYVEGQNLRIERRYSEGKAERLPDLAIALVRLKLDLIVVDACGAPLNATSQATRTIPIVVAACNDDLVATGLISSLARPGGNITGLSELTPELGAKRLELLKQAASGMRRVAVLWNPTYSERFNPNFRFWTSDWKEMRAAAQALDVTLQSVECAWGLWGRSYSRLDDISHRGRWNIQGVLVPWPPVLRLGQVIRGPVEVCQNSLCGRRIFPWYSVGNCQVRVS